jgi:hypothetical protein
MSVSQFANIGLPSSTFREKAVSAYSVAVHHQRDLSIDLATKEEDKAGDNDIDIDDDDNDHDNDHGLVIMSDARHGCRTNSFHSDILALGYTNYKVVGYSHVNKRDEPSSQKHDLYGVKQLYGQFETRGVKIDEHVHDRNTSVTKYIHDNHPTIKNSYDTWHATKEVRRHLKKITSGPRKTSGTIWHPELADKAAGIKTHIYWSMKNCDGREDGLRQGIDSITPHYQNDHRSCHPTSRCKQAGYLPSRLILADPLAINILDKCIKSLIIYKSPSNYIRCRNTHYVESCNNTFLIYLDKRIHYHDNMYTLRSGLAIIDWNEHVDREATSVYVNVNAVNPRRRAPKRNPKPKQYTFVSDLGNLFVRIVCDGQGGLLHGVEDFSDDDGDDSDDAM